MLHRLHGLADSITYHPGKNEDTFYSITNAYIYFRKIYLLIFSGVDIPHLLQSLNFSDSIINSVKDSSMGHLAIALLCYKLAGPFRYMLTIGNQSV